MGFLQKIKDIFGIGGVKIAIDCEKQFSRSGNRINGKLILTTKSDKEITGFTVHLKENWQTGRGDSKTTKEFELGEVELSQSFMIKPGETREIPFSLEYSLLKSGNDKLLDGGKVGKALGSIGKFMDAEKSTFRIGASAGVKGNVFPPTAIVELKLV